MTFSHAFPGDGPDAVILLHHAIRTDRFASPFARIRPAIAVLTISGIAGQGGVFAGLEDGGGAGEAA